MKIMKEKLKKIRLIIKILSDNDISADRDESNSIEWDYNLEDKNKKTPEKEKKNSSVRWKESSQINMK